MNFTPSTQYDHGVIEFDVPGGKPPWVGDFIGWTVPDASSDPDPVPVLWMGSHAISAESLSKDLEVSAYIQRLCKDADCEYGCREVKT